MPVYLIAKEKLSDDIATQLTKAIMETRGSLIGEHPILAQITAPSTEKDAAIPIHPGAEAYFSGDVKTIFDKYGDQFFYASMLLGHAEFAGGRVLEIHDADARGRTARPNGSTISPGGSAMLPRPKTSTGSRTRSTIFCGPNCRVESASDTDAGALQIALSRLEYLIKQRRRIVQAPLAG